MSAGPHRDQPTPPGPTDNRSTTRAPARAHPRPPVPFKRESLGCRWGAMARAHPIHPTLCAASGLVLAGLLVACAAPSRPSSGPTTPTSTTPTSGATRPSSSTLGPCPLFPADNVWHADVRSLSTHPRSDDWRGTIGTTKGLKADFGSGTWAGGAIGIPFTRVGAGQANVPVSFAYDDESDPGPYPIPADAPVEAGSDHHVIVVDDSTCRLYETYDSTRQSDGSWTAGSGATWELRSNALRPAGWTSADAAGLPILAGLVRYEEVAAGNIDHAVRFTAPVTQRSYVWPARHQAGSTSSATAPPMGAWFRLRADFDTSVLGPQARVVADALKVHGMVLADNGSAWYLSGAPDERWDNDDLRTLASIKGTDLVAVDAAPLMVSPDSGTIR